MSEIKMVTTPVLLDMFARAKKQGFNRQGIELDLDMDGIHVLSMALYGHNMDNAPVFHHRINVLAKVNGSDEPVGFLLDVEDSFWKTIPDLEQVKRLRWLKWKLKARSNL